MIDSTFGNKKNEINLLNFSTQAILTIEWQIYFFFLGEDGARRCGCCSAFCFDILWP